MSNDVRKEFIGKFLSNHFNDTALSISKYGEVDNFLNSANCLTLVAYLDSSKNLRIDSQVSVKHLQ